jgi:hypothetical protein
MSRHDPELHLIRSVAHAVEGRGRTEIEIARFNLFAALEGDDHDAATRWAEALEVALTTYAGEAVRPQALAALERIRAAMESR